MKFPFLIKLVALQSCDRLELCNVIWTFSENVVANFVKNHLNFSTISTLYVVACFIQRVFAISFELLCHVFLRFQFLQSLDGFSLFFEAVTGMRSGTEFKLLKSISFLMLLDSSMVLLCSYLSVFFC